MGGTRGAQSGGDFGNLTGDVQLVLGIALGVPWCCWWSPVGGSTQRDEGGQRWGEGGMGITAQLGASPRSC